MKKTVSVLLKIPLFAVAGVVALLVLLFLVNVIATGIERASYKVPGQLVEVAGKKIHVYTVGDGTTNVVLLSGLGTAIPMYDFSGLAHELQAKARVTVLEYPGYGLSDDTDEPRLTATSVEEIRSALSSANVLPPYILVPHSISGLQALYYANHYPSELKGVVGLDTSVPAQAAFMDFTQPQADTNELFRVLGIVRVALAVDPGLSGAPSMGLSDTEVSEYNKIANWILGSHAIANENKALKTNFESLKDLNFPSDLPLTFVLASDSLRATKPIPGAAWREMHERQIAGNPKGKILDMHGDHYIHHNNAKAIADLVFEMIEATK